MVVDCQDKCDKCQKCWAWSGKHQGMNFPFPCHPEYHEVTEWMGKKDGEKLLVAAVLAIHPDTVQDVVALEVVPHLCNVQVI